MQESWARKHWKQVLSYIFFGIIAIFGSLRDALNFVLTELSGVSLPSAPSLGGLSTDLIASLVGIVGLGYLIIRDTGRAHLVLTPSNRTRFSIVGGIDAISIGYCLWGWSQISSPHNLVSNVNLSFLVTGGATIGTVVSMFLTIDLVGSLQGRWKPGSAVTDIARQMINPSPERTASITEFLRVLHTFQGDWEYQWSRIPTSRDVGLGMKATLSLLTQTYARIQSEATPVSPALNNKIRGFLAGLSNYDFTKTNGDYLADYAKGLASDMDRTYRVSREERGLF